jgi:hypothetical protein
MFYQNRTLWFGKSDHPVFPDWQNLVLLFEHLIALLDQKCVDDDEIFSGSLDDDLLLLLEPYICSSTFQRRLTLLSKPYSISISSFISALKALDKALDA